MKKELSFEDQKAEITAVADRVGKSGKILRKKNDKRSFFKTVFFFHGEMEESGTISHQC